MSDLPIRSIAPQMPPTLAVAYVAAQTRLRQSFGAHYNDQYPPLMQLVEQGKRWGGQHAATALEACQEIAQADEAAIARMVVLGRPAPGMQSGLERADARHAATVHTNRLAGEVAAMISRPRVTLAEQLSAMESRGIRISVQGRHLKVHAPDGVVTEADRALLREHKPEIIAWLDTNAETF